MSYCPKCGNKVDETLALCSVCGTSLKDSASPIQSPPSQPYPNEKIENDQKKEKPKKNQHLKKGERQERSDHGFISYLMGGLIFITIGVFALLDFTRSSALNPSQDLAGMLLTIGAIIITGAVYMTIKGRKPSCNQMAINVSK